MKNRIVLLMTALSLLDLAGCQKEEEAGNVPKLVVLIIIDGLSAELLDRYDQAFQGGFRRLRDQGLRFANAWVDHAITVSHAGHVTLATGCMPSRHGIVDAAFYVPKELGRVLVDAVEDTTESILGFPESRGVSPRQILVDGLADWIREADPEARTLSVGSGYVSSLLHSFHSPGDVYWYSDGQYVTSTYYRDDYPDWVVQFNEKVLPGMIDSARRWPNSIPSKFRRLSLPDSSSYEADKVHTVFPHVFENEFSDTTQRSLFRWFSWTPFKDFATLSLAKAGIKSLQLGQRDATDYLAIVLSQTDGTSHYYGLFSQEMLDVLLRLDAALEEFFGFLDSMVGEGKYVVALSSDHGSPNIPEYQQSRGLPGRRIREEEIEAVFDDVSTVMNKPGMSPRELEEKVAALVAAKDFVAETYRSRDLEQDAKAENDFFRLYRNSFRPDRIPRLPFFSLRTLESPVAQAGVMMRLTEGTIIDLDVTIHGSPYDYDRRVPMIFLGTGVRAGVTGEPVRTVDVAPTLARLAGIHISETIDGQSLIE